MAWRHHVRAIGLAFASHCVTLGGCSQPAAPQPAVRSVPLETDEMALARAWIESETRLSLRGKNHRFELRAPPRAELELAFGLPPKGKPWIAWPADVDRVDFTVAHESADGREVLMARRIERPADGWSRWHDALIDLGAVAGRSGTLTLEAEVYPPAADPPIAWTNPRLRTPAGAGRTNVILISIDTLRADHLGCYGYERSTSPHIDAMAAEGVRFENFVASSPWTLPSHASMLTGLDPARHRAQIFTPVRALSLEFDTLAERLWREGYETAGFVGGGFLGTVLGFGQGFDRYWETQDRMGDTDTLRAAIAAAKPWVEQRRGAPFFLFLHTYQVHAPFTPPPSSLALFDPGYRGPYQTAFTGTDAASLQRRGEPLEPRILRRLMTLYDGEIRAMDAAVGELLSFLRDSELARNTCVFLTSDHGEEFGEHGDILHSKAKLYEELIHIPLIAWCPSRFDGGHSVSALASHTDIVPTIAELAGAESATGLDGRSLIAALRGSQTPTRDVAISQVDGSIQRRPGEVKAVRSAQYKLIESSIDGSTVLFDLTADPTEQRDLHAEQATLADTLRAAVEPRAPASAAAADQPAALDEAMRERLRALGYDQ